MLFTFNKELYSKELIMGLALGDEDEVLTSKVDIPKEVNPIDTEIVLTPEVLEHDVLSVEMVQNKRPWFEDLARDMYNDSITEIDGNRVYSEFFSTLVKDDSISSATSNLISASHREYMEIKDYPVYLDGDVNTDTNATSQKTDTSSTAVISGVLPPQTSDYFTINTGINRTSLFKIKSVKPLSIYLSRAYAIEYEMQEVNLGQVYADLKSKCTRRLSYIRENHQIGIKYLLTDEEVNLRIEDRMLDNTLYNQYVSEFYNRDLKVFGVSTPNGFHTDMIIQKFVTTLHGSPDDMYAYTEYDDTASLSTIFDVLLRLSSAMMMNVMTKVYYYNLTSPTDITAIHPVLTSPVSSMPFQKSSRMMESRPPSVATSVIHGGGQCTLGEITIGEIFPLVSPTVGTTFPNVLRNETYILGEAFYTGTSGCDLEELIRDAIEHRPISRSRIIDVVSALSLLSREERFFITPFVMALLKINKG